MLKTLRYGKVCYGHQRTIHQTRLFLTEAYRCEEAWNRRVETPLLKNIRVADMLHSLDRKLSAQGKVSAIDVDIVANTVTEKTYVNDVINLLRILRQTSEATDIFESTHHAVVRFMLGCNSTDELLSVLHDRLNHGIFPDYLCYNILMDTFIEKEEYANAAKVAVLPMLQEDAEHPITNALSVYSCHKYLERPDDWKKPEVPVDDSEEIKIRVAYIRNPYFDSHFDLTDPLDLVGKTLAFQGKHMNDVLGRTCELRGFMLYKKYHWVVKLIDSWLNEIKEDNTVYEEVFDLIERDISYVTEDQMTKTFKAAQSKLQTLKSTNLKKEPLIDTLENNIKVAIQNQTEKDIAEQCQKYIEWENNRQTELDKQLREIDTQRRKANIEKIKEELKEKEQLLTFFENEEEIELEIEQIEQREKEELESVLKLPKGEKKLRKLKEAEQYSPPTVGKPN